MTSQTGKQIFTMHILPNISISKANQTMKFGQLIEYNMRNIFLEKLCRKWGGKTNARPLFNRQHVIFSFFWYTSTWTSIKTHFMQSQHVDAEIYPTLNFMKGSGTSFLTMLCVWFFKKNIDHVIFYLTKCHCLGAFTAWYIGQCDVMTFKSNFSSRFPTWLKKAGQIFKYLKNKKCF